MICFEVGKSYMSYGRKETTITITARTKHYVTFIGAFSGRKKIEKMPYWETFSLPRPDVGTYYYTYFSDESIK